MVPEWVDPRVCPLSLSPKMPNSDADDHPDHSDTNVLLDHPPPDHPDHPSGAMLLDHPDHSGANVLLDHPHVPSGASCPPCSSSSSPSVAESEPLLLVHEAEDEEPGEDGAVPGRETEEQREPFCRRDAEKQRKEKRMGKAKNGGDGAGLLDRWTSTIRDRGRRRGTRGEFRSASYRDMVRKGQKGGRNFIFSQIRPKVQNVPLA